MAGQLTIDTLKASSGVLATQNGMTGIAKAWGNINITAGTINNSFNVSSVTKNGTGDITVSFSTALPNTTYTVCGGSGQYPSSSWWPPLLGIACDASGNILTKTTSQVRLTNFNNYSSSAGPRDSTEAYFSIFSA